MCKFRAFSRVGYRMIPPVTTLTGGTNGGIFLVGEFLPSYLP